MNGARARRRNNTGRDRRYSLFAMKYDAMRKSRWSARLLLATTIGTFGCSGADTAAPPASIRQPCRLGVALCASRIEIMPGRFLKSYQSFSLVGGDSLVTQAVIVVHGVDRNANDYFSSMNDAAALAGRSLSTIVIAPQFQTSDDTPTADEPVWTSNGWRAGDLSSSTGPLPRISSYAAIDTILARLSNRTKFARLARIVVVGHSAGGQLVHRYAATSRIALPLTDIPIRYIAANPSTWLYLGPERGAGNGFAIPASAADCADYDDWHYGLQSRNTYANAVTVTLLKQNLVSRDVIVMLGTADTLTADLDVSCGADLQGPRRYQRGLTLMNYMNALNPGNGHRLVTVVGVGHSNSAMFTSVDGRRAIFP